MKIPDIAEQRAIKLFTNEFGIDKRSRFNKFKEEINELEEAFEHYMNSDEQEKIEALPHLLDELSDVKGTFTHLASLFGLYQREMLHNCIDKVTTRKTNPDYKRFRFIGGTYMSKGVTGPFVNCEENFKSSDHNNHNDI